MPKFSNDTSFVIARNEAVQAFCRVNPDGSHNVIDNDGLSIHAMEKAGDVAKLMAQKHPDKQIGILADTIGPIAKRIYGEIVWLRKGFEQD